MTETVTVTLLPEARPRRGRKPSMVANPRQRTAWKAPRQGRYDD
jgi:hypothetical protein